MGKSHRGRPLRNEVKSSFRGTCPVSGQSGVKLLYEHEINGVKTIISKIGRAKLANTVVKDSGGADTATLEAAPVPAAVEDTGTAAGEEAAPAAVEDTGTAAGEEAAPAAVEDTGTAAGEEAAPAAVEDTGTAAGEEAAPAPAAVEDTGTAAGEEAAPAAVEDTGIAAGEEAAAGETAAE